MYRANRSFATKIPAKPHWYTMRVQASGPTAPGLFAAETDVYHFQARAGDSGLARADFWPRIIPAGLDWQNAARSGTTTTARIYFTDQAGNIAAHGVTVQASVNDGKTWTTLRASQDGRRWTAVVPNPGTAGYVSLRVRGTSAAGFTSSVTVIHAYAVS